MNARVTPNGMVTIPVSEIVGSVRTLGPLGPAYEVLEQLPARAGEPVEFRIKVVESGEEIAYDLDNILADPLAP